MIVPRREPEFSLNSIDGQKVWPKEERDLFFRKSSGENAVAMMDEWSRGRCGRITNIGALNDIARKMADDGSELTAENLFKYYFTGKLAKEREESRMSTGGKVGIGCGCFIALLIAIGIAVYIAFSVAGLSTSF